MLVTLIAQWYKPAMSFLGQLDDLSREYPSVLFALIDLDESLPLVRHLGFLEQPGMRVYLKGQKATEISGLTVFNNPAELDTILRFELEKRGAVKVDVMKPDVAGIIQQAMQLARPGGHNTGNTLKLRPGPSTDEATEAAISAAVKAAPAPKYTYLPNREYQMFASTANMAVIETKTISFSQTHPECHLSDEQLANVKGLIAILSEADKYSFSNFEDGQLEVLQTMLQQWPTEHLFPVLDLLRLALVHPIGRAYFLHSPIIPSILQTAKNAPFPYQFMAFKAICNLFDSRITKQLVINLFEAALSLCSHLASSTNKNLQLVSSTLLLNYTTFLIKEGITDDVYQPTPLLNVINALLVETKPQSDDAVFRLAISVGSLHMFSKIAQERTKSLIDLLNQHAEALKAATPPLSEHSKVALAELASLLGSHST